MPKKSTHSIFSKKAKSGTDAIVENGGITGFGRVLYGSFSLMKEPKNQGCIQMVAFGDDKPKYTETEPLKIGHWAF